MAFRSGYRRVQNPSIITEKKHFPFKQRNQQPCTTRPEKKKKIELPQNKQIFSSVSGSLERIKQAFLYWSCLRTFMLTSALVPIYAAGFYTLTSGGHSNFRLLTKCLQKRRPEKSHPQLGGGGSGEALGFEFISKPLLCPWGEDIKNRRQIFHRERVRKLSHGVNTPVRRMPLFVGWNPEMRESICRALVKVSTQKELAIFCWPLGWRS